MLEDGGAEGAGAAGDHEGFVVEDVHSNHDYIISYYNIFMVNIPNSELSIFYPVALLIERKENSVHLLPYRLLTALIKLSLNENSCIYMLSTIINSFV